MLAALVALTTTSARADDTAADDSRGEESKPVFLVTDIQVAPGLALDAAAARDVLSTRFGRFRDKLEVRSLTEVKSTLDEVALAQLMGNTERDADIAKVSSYVNVDRLVFGRVTDVGAVIDVQVRVFNAREGVTEIALSRRLKKDAPASLLLAVVDGLADTLAVWALKTYGGGTPSAAFLALKGKKVSHEEPVVVAPQRSPWSFLGIGGGALVGVGLAGIATGAAILTSDVPSATRQPIGFTAFGAGIGAVAIGGALVVYDGITE